MANGIYTEPIPTRDINEDIRYLGEVLARNAALKQKNDQAKIKALNEAKARSAKALYDQFQYDIESVPEYMRPAFEEFRSAQEQEFLYYSTTGDVLKSKEVLNRFANVYGEMKEHKSSSLDAYKAAVEVVGLGIDASSKKDLGVGFKYDSDFYTADNVDDISKKYMEGRMYDMTYEPSSGFFSVLNKDGDRVSIKNINEIYRYADATPLSGGKVQFAAITTSQWASETWDSSLNKFGMPLGKVYREELERAKSPGDVKGQRESAFNIFSDTHDDLFDSLQEGGAQLRLTAIVDYSIQGANSIPEEFISSISDGVTPERYAETVGVNKAQAKNYAKSYNTVKQSSKDNIFNLISDEIKFKPKDASDKTKAGYTRRASLINQSDLQPQAFYGNDTYDYKVSIPTNNMKETEVITIDQIQYNIDELDVYVKDGYISKVNIREGKSTQYKEVVKDDGVKEMAAISDAVNNKELDVRGMTPQFNQLLSDKYAGLTLEEAVREIINKQDSNYKIEGFEDPIVFPKQFNLNNSVDTQKEEIEAIEALFKSGAISEEMKDNLISNVGK